MTPKRIQRKRAKGWRMPDGAVYVGRPSPWGNPWPINGEMQPWLALALGERADAPGRRRSAVTAFRWWIAGMTEPFPVPTRDAKGDWAVEYTDGTVRTASDIVTGMGVMMLTRAPIAVPAVPDLEPLRGHDLVCWCPIGQPCHADVLLELANR